MKNNKLLKMISVFLILTMFAGMAMASSSSGSSSKSSTKITADGDNKDNGSDDSKSESGGDDAEGKKGEMKYEITDTHFEHFTNSIDVEELFGYVEVTNTGTTNLYLNGATFDFEDDDGHLLQSESGYGMPPVIAPGEKGYFYEGCYLDDGISLKNGINLVPTVKIEEAMGDITEYEVIDTDLTKDTLGPKITGRVVNNSNDDVSCIVLDIYLFDKNGKIVGLESSSIYDEVEAGSKISFDKTMIYTFTNIKFEDISDYKIIARSDYYQF